MQNNLRKILFATDFSESCEIAFDFVLSLLNGNDTSVDIIHVYNLQNKSLYQTSHNKVLDSLNDNKLRVLDQLKVLQDRLDQKNRGEIYATYGVRPSTDILDKAYENESSLIVVGMRDKYKFIDRIIGTVTSNLFHRSKVPVLAIPYRANFMAPYKVLMPTQLTSIKKLDIQHGEAIQLIDKMYHALGKPELQILHVEKGDLIDIHHLQSIGKKHLKFSTAYADTIYDGVSKYLSQEEYNFILFLKADKMLWEKILKSSVTRKVLYKLGIPIMLYP